MMNQSISNNLKETLSATVEAPTVQKTNGGDAATNRPFIIQNGNVYQLTSANQLISTSKSVPTSGADTKNVILNTIQQSGNLNQRIKMTTVKNSSPLNVNLNTSKSKVVYRTVNDLLQPQQKAINIIPNQPKQIIIQGGNTNSRLSALINNTSNSNGINGNKSVIVLGSNNQRLSQSGDQNSPNTVQYIIQQKQPTSHVTDQQRIQPQQQQPPKQTVYLSGSPSVISNIKSASATTLAPNKIQNILEQKQQNQQHQFNQTILENSTITDFNNPTNSPGPVVDSNKNVIYVLNTQNNQNNSQQQIIKLNKSNPPGGKPIPSPPVVTNSILKAHLNSNSDNLIRQHVNETHNNSTDTNLKFALQSNATVQHDIQQSQEYTSELNPQPKLKTKEIVKITPVAINNQIKHNQLNAGTLHSPQPVNMVNRSVESPKVQPAPKKTNTIKKTLKENQEILSRRDSTNQDQNLVKCMQNPSTMDTHPQTGFDENFVPSDDFLNDLLLPDTRIFASLLNKDLNKANNQSNPTNNCNSSKKTHADLTYKTVMIGNTEHIILDNLTNLSDYRGDFAKLQTLASAVANKFNKPVTIPAFMMMPKERAIEKIKEELMEKSIQPIVIENYEYNENSSCQVPNSVFSANGLFQGNQQIVNNHINSTSKVDQTNGIKKETIETKKEVNGSYQQAYQGVNQSQQLNSMNINSHNHHLIQSLKSEPKMNQQQQVVPNQRFYTDTPMGSCGETNVTLSAPQSPAVKETKKATKPRKTPTPKNPNTPKRRKTVGSKEKINQMSIGQIHSENLTDNILITANNLHATVGMQNEQVIEMQQTQQLTAPAKKIRKARNSTNLVSSMAKLDSPLRETSASPAPHASLTNNTIIDQRNEANNIQMQNIQIQNIANDLLRVKDDMQNMEAQNTQANNLQAYNFINNASHQIQTQQQQNPGVQDQSNTNLNSLVNFQFIADTAQVLSEEKKEPIVVDSQIYINSSSNNVNSQVNEVVSQQTQVCGNSSGNNINEYDFNFDPFDSNALFNLNDMEFI